jgi:hypothetical protein
MHFYEYGEDMAAWMDSYQRNITQALSVETEEFWTREIGLASRIKLNPGWAKEDRVFLYKDKAVRILFTCKYAGGPENEFCCARGIVLPPHVW